MKDVVFDKMIEFFKVHGFCGEALCQSDLTIIDGPEFFGDLADDIIKFKVEYKNENEN